jgi:hydroxymethylpyrimidine/phosphomethylpyrimidine kinase
MKKYATALTIAGSDSGGGAGIQADLKTFAALGCYGASVITALTAQNTHQVRAIHPVPQSFISEQLQAVLEDISVDAIKIGMLHDAAVIEAIATELQKYPHIPVVLDPVMVSTSGAKLIEDAAIEALKQHLFPLAALITPNLYEAAELTGKKLSSKQQFEVATNELLAQGAKAVLLKGGHLEGKAEDYFFNATTKEAFWLSNQRIDTGNTHGTGCSLSSAVAARLAKGATLAEAVREAKNWLSGALAAGADYKLGNGHGPVHHFYRWWE